MFLVFTGSARGIKENAHNLQPVSLKSYNSVSDQLLMQYVITTFSTKEKGHWEGRAV
jgi:hypothetical protein